MQGDTFMKSFKNAFVAIVFLSLSLASCGKTTNKSQSRAVNYHGIPLIAEGVHMSKGTHNYVITDQFYEHLIFDTLQQDQDMVINALNEAYLNLDKYTPSLNLKLCTTVDELANKYSIQKIDSIDEKDIALYITNTGTTKATYNFEAESKEMKDLSITFNKEDTLSFWHFYNKTKDLFDAYNTCVYTYAVRTGMETMGIGYFNNRKSIMNDSALTDENSSHDLTEYDIEILGKYCIEFYGSDWCFADKNNVCIYIKKVETMLNFFKIIRMKLGLFGSLH